MQIPTIGDWVYVPTLQQTGQVIAVQQLWGATVCRLYLPGRQQVLELPLDALRPTAAAPAATAAHILYTTAAARIAAALTQDVLLAPLSASVIPLPHQLHALNRALQRDDIRYLLADEVGLGKTIEAGLIVRELKLRGLVQRILVVAPKGLVTQWAAEMQTHFQETFTLLTPGQVTAVSPLLPDANLWQAFDQVIVSMDSVKPIDGRRGWTPAQLAEYNRVRFDDLTAAGWDLIIVDEAHRLGGSTDQVARFRLGQGLAAAAPYVLLLSATPHQGKTDAFRRLLSLLDEQAFPDDDSITRDRVRPYVIRTEKRRAVTAAGDPLFQPRRTDLMPVAWQDRHRLQSALYAAVTDYVREGYNQAQREQRTYIGFLMVLMQRMVTSSTAAIRSALERRLDALQSPVTQFTFAALDEEEWLDLDGQEQVDIITTTRVAALNNEQAEVTHLLELANRAGTAHPDAKADALLSLIYTLQQEQRDPDLKVLIFTEFVATQTMLQEFLESRGISVVCLNGSMDLDARRHVQQQFAGPIRVLISTDAGGEGLNLQFCHVVVNYDIPWNPMRLEQRIGRVDRIGQAKPVHAVNFVLEDTVEFRVREVLEAKLAVIYQEFGIDKTGDVLDSSVAGRWFEDLYVDSLLDPTGVETRVDVLLEQVRAAAAAEATQRDVLGAVTDVQPERARHVLTHPLPSWVERMTVNYLLAHGGQAHAQLDRWTLTWPDGRVQPNVTFSRTDAPTDAQLDHLTLESPSVRRLVDDLPRLAGAPVVPSATLPQTPSGVSGYWSLWRIALQTPQSPRHTIMPLFLHDDGRILAPTAARIWDLLLVHAPQLHDQITGEAARHAQQASRAAALDLGEPHYHTLLAAHQQSLAQAEAKTRHAFAARRRAVSRLGLAEVRNYRLRQLAQAEQAALDALDARRHALPQIEPLIILHIAGNRP